MVFSIRYVFISLHCARVCVRTILLLLVNLFVCSSDVMIRDVATVTHLYVFEACYKAYIEYHYLRLSSIYS